MNRSYELILMGGRCLCVYGFEISEQERGLRGHLIQSCHLVNWKWKKKVKMKVREVKWGASSHNYVYRLLLTLIATHPIHFGEKQTRAPCLAAGIQCFVVFMGGWPLFLNKILGTHRQQKDCLTTSCQVNFPLTSSSCSSPCLLLQGPTVPRH